LQKAKWRRLRRPISDCFLAPQRPAASLSPRSLVNSLRVHFLDGQSHHAQTPAVLDHSRTLPQGDGHHGSPCHRCHKSALYSTLVASPFCKSFTRMTLYGCLRLRCSAAAMANALRSRYVRGVPSIETSNRAPGVFVRVIGFS